MNIREAVDYLKARDYRCSEATLRRLARDRKVAHYRLGATGRGRLEFTAARLDEFLRAAEVRPESVPPRVVRARARAVSRVRREPPPTPVETAEARRERLRRAVES